MNLDFVDRLLGLLLEIFTNLLRQRLIQRTGMCLFFLDANFWQCFQDRLSLHFELSCKLVDPYIVLRFQSGRLSYTTNYCLIVINLCRGRSPLGLRPLVQGSFLPVR